VSPINICEARKTGIDMRRREILMPVHNLSGFLAIPDEACGLVLFVHGSGSSRFSPRNTMVAERLNSARIATLLFDLLSEEESENRENVFDIELLAERLAEATRWARGEADVSALPIGYFGASTGAGAALTAAATGEADIAAIVSRGGRPDLAPMAALHRVRAPTLLIVGSRDDVVVALNRQALAELKCEAKIEIVPGATHLFEEAGALEHVADLATDWFLRYFRPEKAA
jgi:putative phosphoribosyl transferase